MGSSAATAPQRVLNCVEHPVGHAVVGEHEVLQRLVAELVVADRRDDERGSFGRGVLLAVDNEAPGVGEWRRRCFKRCLTLGSRWRSVEACAWWLGAGCPCPRRIVETTPALP